MPMKTSTSMTQESYPYTLNVNNNLSNYHAHKQQIIEYQEKASYISGFNIQEGIHDMRRAFYFCHSKENQVELLSFSRMALKIPSRQQH